MTEPEDELSLLSYIKSMVDKNKENVLGFIIRWSNTSHHFMSETNRAFILEPAYNRDSSILEK